MEPMETKPTDPSDELDLLQQIPEQQWERSDWQRLQLFIYFVPVLGFFPALWALYVNRGDRRQQVASRASVTLGLTWILTYALLSAGASSADSSALTLWILSSITTSGYFFVNFWLMVRIWRRKTLWIPGISDAGDRLP